MIDIAPKEYYDGLLKEAIPCPVCEASTHYQVASLDRYNMGINTVLCSECGLIYLNPRPTEEEMQLFYQKSYRLFYEAVETPTAEYIKNGPFVSRANFVINELEKHENLTEATSFLDVGCAEGTLLSMVMKKYSRIKGYGVEPSESFGAYAKEHTQATVHVGTYQEFFQKNPALKFDVIATTHVLEHILDPKAYLDILCNALSEQGILYIEVPNAMSEKYRTLSAHIGHVLSYDPETLTLAVQKSGLEVIDLLVDSLPARTPSMAVVCKRAITAPKLILPAKEAIERKRQQLAERVKQMSANPGGLTKMINAVKRKLK